MLCKALPSSTCDALVRAMTLKGFEPSFVAPLTVAMIPCNESVVSVQRTVLQSLFNPHRLHGLFGRRQVVAPSGASIRVSELMVRETCSVGCGMCGWGGGTQG